MSLDARRILAASPMLQREIVRAYARIDLPTLFRLAMPIVAPAAAFVDAWFYKAIDHQIRRLGAGEAKWVGIALPPRCGKSLLISVVLPAFLLGRDPTLGIMCVSHSRQLASKFANDFRRLVASPRYHEIFPNMRIDRRKDNETETMTTAGGFRYATSVDGTVTGRGAEYVIADDLLQPEDAESDAMRGRVNDFIAKSLSTRSNNKQAPKFLVVMQRLHTHDPIGFLSQGGELDLLALPAETDIDRDIPIGAKRTYRWPAGALLSPQLLPAEYLEAQKRLMGTAAYNAQFLCSPLPALGNLFRWVWFEFYDHPPEPDWSDTVIQSWDTAVKAGELNDYSVCITALLRGSRYYILDIFRDKLEYPALKQKVRELALRWRANTLLVEDTMSGQALVQELRAENMGDLGSLIPIRAEHDKVMRAKVASPAIEARQVFLPRAGGFLEDFKAEILAFPLGAHDDQVDALTQLLNWGEPWRRAHDQDGIIGIPEIFR